MLNKQKNNIFYGGVIKNIKFTRALFACYNVL